MSIIKRAFFCAASLALMSYITAGQAQSSSADIPSPQTFVTKAAIDGRAEVELGRMAQKNTDNTAVRKLAQRLVRDHTRINAQLSAIAKRKGLHVPTRLDAAHRKVYEELRAGHGEAFDTDYLTQMAQAHDKAIALFQQAQMISDPDLAAFATRTLPILQTHKQLIENLQANPQASGAR